MTADESPPGLMHLKRIFGEDAVCVDGDSYVIRFPHATLKADVHVADTSESGAYMMEQERFAVARERTSHTQIHAELLRMGLSRRDVTKHTVSTGNIIRIKSAAAETEASIAVFSELGDGHFAGFAVGREAAAPLGKF